MNINASQSVVWDPVPGATGYEAEVSEAPTGGAVLSVSLVAGPALPCAAIFPSAPHGTSRKVRARAVDDNGASNNWSGYLGVTLVGLPAPQNLRVE